MRDPSTEGGTCQSNFDSFTSDPLWNNGGYISYVSQGTNHAPSVTINSPSAPGTDMVIDGTVTDSAPDDGNLVVAVTSDLDGFLGTASISATGNSDSSPQTTDWVLSVTGASSGSHTLTVDAVDAAGIVRSGTLSLTVP
jgi:VCBS repeat-containing protein